MDSDDENPWGEEPEWLQEQDNENNNEDDEEGGRRMGARHVVVLLDCHSSMWNPCIRLIQDDDDDETEESQPLQSPMDVALTICERWVRHKVLQVATHPRTGKRDGMGILLYGTQPLSKEELNSPRPSQDDDDKQDDDNEEEEDDRSIPSSGVVSTTHTLLPLEPPGIPHVKDLLECLPNTKLGGQRSRNLQDHYALKETMNDSHTFLRSALQEAKMAFALAKCVRAPSSKSPQDTKSLWIFTTNDDPCAGDTQEQQHMETMAKDAAESGIRIHVLPLKSSSQHSFDVTKFWNRIIRPSPLQPQGDPVFVGSTTWEEEGGATSSATPSLDVDDVLRHLQKWEVTRKVFSHPLLLPDWKDRGETEETPHIMLDFYRVVQLQRKPTHVMLHQQTKRETVRITQVLDEETGEILATLGKHAPEQPPPPFEPGGRTLSSYTKFGSEQVPLTKADVADIKKQSNATDFASLVLRGFRHVDSIPLHLTLDRSYFLYPNEAMVKGSTAAFANLHASMLRKNVLAVAELLTRKSATSRLVALYPQQEEVSFEEGVGRIQMKPPGMILTELPFEDDIRELGEDRGHVEPTEESIDSAAKMMSKLGLDFAAGIPFENQALEEFWSYIEAIALDTKVKEDFDPLVDEEAILERAGALIEAFRTSLPEDVKEVKKRASRKRQIVEDDSGCDWEELYRTDSLSECTVDMLKSFLRSKGSRVSGKKADLVYRVGKMIEEDMGKTT